MIYANSRNNFGPPSSSPPQLGGLGCGSYAPDCNIHVYYEKVIFLNFIENIVVLGIIWRHKELYRQLETMRDDKCIVSS